MASKISEQLNFRKQAKDWGIPFWQHPQILFGILGLLTIGSDLLLYLLGTQYIKIDYSQLVLIIFAVSVFFLFVSFFIERSFEKMADASRIKTEFIGIVSHQLRTPVTNLSLILDLVKNECPGLVNDQNGYFDLMRQNTDRIKDLISNLLIASRIDKGDFAMPNPEDIDLEKEINDAMSHVYPLTGKKKVKINYSKESAVPIILGNQSQMKMILENLLTNAILYNKENGSIDVKSGIRGKNIFVEVADTGIGIPESDKFHIAEKFHRAGNANRFNPGGTGLGLFIVKSLLKPLKGRLNFKSKEGEGSVFWISIPIKSNAKLGK